MTTPTHEKRKRIDVSCDAWGETRVGAIEFEMQERLARPFKLELTLASPSQNIDPFTMIGQKARVEISGLDSSRTIRGVFDEFSQCAPPNEKQPGLSYYKAVLRPLIYDLSYGESSRIFLSRSVIEIIDALLGGENSIPHRFDLSETSDYPQRKYTAQYQQSDLRFIHSLLEQEGISYWFDESGPQQTVVFCDDNARYAQMSSAGNISFVAPSDLVAGKEAIYKLSISESFAPAQVTLDDFDPSRPFQNLRSDSKKTGGKVGAARLWGAGYDTPDTAKGASMADRKVAARLAAVRAEEIASSSFTAKGASTVCELAPGRRFKLTGHFRASANGHYLTVQAQSRGRQNALFALRIEDNASGMKFENSFSLVRSDGSAKGQYRPPCSTQRPPCFGVMQAVVEAPKGQFMPYLEQGDYRLRMHFDLEQTPKTEGSAQTPLVRPYQAPRSASGKPSGFHFPLPDGASVIWSAVNGDIGRPVILGALPSMLRKPSFNKKQSLPHGFSTSSGKKIELHDESSFSSQADGLQDKGFIMTYCPNSSSRSFFYAGGDSFSGSASKAHTILGTHFEWEMPNATDSTKFDRQARIFHGVEKSGKDSSSFETVFDAHWARSATAAHLCLGDLSETDEGRKSGKGLLFGGYKKPKSGEDFSWLQIGKVGTENGIRFSTSSEETELFIGNDGSDDSLILTTEGEAVAACSGFGDNGILTVNSMDKIDEPFLGGLLPGKESSWGSFLLGTASMVLSLTLANALRKHLNYTTPGSPEDTAARTQGTEAPKPSFWSSGIAAKALPILTWLIGAIRFIYPEGFRPVKIDAPGEVNIFGQNFPISFVSLINTKATSALNCIGTGFGVSLGAFGFPKNFGGKLLGTGGVKLESWTGDVSVGTVIGPAEIKSAEGEVKGYCGGDINVRASLLPTSGAFFFGSPNVVAMIRVPGAIMSGGVDGVNGMLIGHKDLIQVQGQNIKFECNRVTSVNLMVTKKIEGQTVEASLL